MAGRFATWLRGVLTSLATVPPDVPGATSGTSPGPVLVTPLDGWKTYVAALGLVGLALYQLSQSDPVHALQSFLAGLAAFGLRHALTNLGISVPDSVPVLPPPTIPVTPSTPPVLQAPSIPPTPSPNGTPQL